MNHGTRTAYTYHRCRCDACTRANADYNREWLRKQARIRYGIQEPTEHLVDSSEARAHLQWLSQNGIGLRTVVIVTGLSRSCLQKIYKGITERSDPRTVELVLAVNLTHRPAKALVDATRTWEQITDLINAGMPKAHIARHISGRSDTLALQIGKARVSRRTAERVNALWFQTMAPDIARREQVATARRELRHRTAA